MNQEERFMAKVFIIEDDPDILELEMDELKDAGFSVRGCKTLMEAKNFLANEQFDCILLDMNLGNVSGKEVIDLLQSEKHLNHSTPVIIVSGSLDVDIVRKVRTSIRGVLVKPVQPDDLIKKINDVIAQAQNEKPKKSKATTSRPLSVLLVDDDLEFTKMLKDFLSGEDINTVSSSKSTDALKKLTNQRFDVILMDLELDARHGDWIINQVRKDKSNLNHQTPIIIVSGYITPTVQELTHVVQGIISKPIKNIELAKKIRAVYNERKEKLKVAA